MLPQVPPWMLEGIAEIILDQQQPTKTYCLNENSKTIAGYVDEIAALNQMVYLTLNTEKDAWQIYTTFGNECRNLIGKPSDFAMAEIPRLVKEALIEDDRVEEVDTFSFEVFKNRIKTSFVVHSIYGDSSLKTEVTI